VGGKAVNVARFAAAVGGDVALVLLADERLADAVGGDSSLAAPGLRVDVVPSPVATRTDLALVDREGGLTVVNGEAADPGAAARKHFEAVCLSRLGGGDVLVLAGSAPPGGTPLVARLATAARGRGATVLVDASGPWLRAALRTEPSAVKVNESEAGGQAASGRRPAHLGAVPIVGVTRAERGLRAWVGDQAYEIRPPEDIDVVNPLGAGDAVTAGLAVVLAARGDPVEGFALGVAMATARLQRLEPRIDAAMVRALLPRVRVTRLG
jgi:fructose-1-phosphate kinase PfkB-like protein